MGCIIGRSKVLPEREGGNGSDDNTTNKNPPSSSNPVLNNNYTNGHTNGDKSSDMSPLPPSSSSPQPPPNPTKSTPPDNNKNNNNTKSPSIPLPNSVTPSSPPSSDKIKTFPDGKVIDGEGAIRKEGQIVDKSPRESNSKEISGSGENYKITPRETKRQLLVEYLCSNRCHLFSSADSEEISANAADLDRLLSIGDLDSLILELCRLDALEKRFKDLPSLCDEVYRQTEKTAKLKANPHIFDDAHESSRKEKDNQKEKENDNLPITKEGPERGTGENYSDDIIMDMKDIKKKQKQTNDIKRVLKMDVEKGNAVVLKRPTTPKLDDDTTTNNNEKRKPKPKKKKDDQTTTTTTTSSI